MRGKETPEVEFSPEGVEVLTTDPESKAPEADAPTGASEETQVTDTQETEPRDNVIVTDRGFGPDHFNAEPLDLGSDTDLGALPEGWEHAAMIRIAFPSFNDGRGFTLAAGLRAKGFEGRLRARGHVIADQYAMARRAGFDEVEISPELAERQPEPQWLARADWRAHDYQARLRGRRPAA
ncbi:DUF934 domain-containing protein [Pseudoroseicyclus sp. CXY001]|uniref:DUF934 domain-containing protein n=1 Tax=Pseudoroseicyclus sp. CXY001 TaxID=3242492 RepID=UPI00358DC9E8